MNHVSQLHREFATPLGGISRPQNRVLIPNMSVGFGVYRSNSHTSRLCLNKRRQQAGAQVRRGKSWPTTLAEKPRVFETQSGRRHVSLGELDTSRVASGRAPVFSPHPSAVAEADLLNALGNTAGVGDPLVKQFRQPLDRLSVLGTVGQVDHLVRVGLVVVEFGSVATILAPFRVPVALRPETVAAGILSQR